MSAESGNNINESVDLHSPDGSHTLHQHMSLSTILAQLEWGDEHWIISDIDVTSSVDNGTSTQCRYSGQGNGSSKSDHYISCYPIGLMVIIRLLDVAQIVKTGVLKV